MREGRRDAGTQGPRGTKRWTDTEEADKNKNREREGGKERERDRERQRERERVRERESERERYIYIYIYNMYILYIYRHTDREGDEERKKQRCAGVLDLWFVSTECNMKKMQASFEDRRVLLIIVQRILGPACPIVEMAPIDYQIHDFRSF